MGSYKTKKNGPKGPRRDIDLQYMKGAHSWNERVIKYGELCTLEYYLNKYEVQHKYADSFI